MSVMVERVARAMCADLGYEWGKGLVRPEDYLSMAEAAIRAIRSPTEAMRQACFSAGSGGWPDVIWPAMIDEALSS